MWEGYVHSILNAILGAYVKEFDPEALKVSVWNGDITIRNVSLKPSVFNSMFCQNYLPFRLKSGTIGSFHLKVPWSSFWSSSIEVAIDAIDLEIEDFSEDTDQVVTAEGTSDQEVPLASRLALKRASIEAQEKARAIKNDDAHKQHGLMNRITIKLIENLQLNLTNLNLRLASNSVVAGVTVEGLRIQSADKDWNFTMQIRGANERVLASCLRKQLQVTKASLYMDTVIAKRDISTDNDAITVSNTTTTTHNYILKPTDTTMRLLLNDCGHAMPLSSDQFLSRVMNRLGTPWMMQTIDLITDEGWNIFVAQMPPLVGGRKYTLSFVFGQAWEVACDWCQDNEELVMEKTASGDNIPTLSVFEKALSSILQWSKSEVADRLALSTKSFRDAAAFVLMEKSTFIDFEIVSNEVSMSLSQKQYREILGAISSISSYQCRCRNAAIRPVQSVSESPKAWWAYAINATLIDVRARLERVDWDRIKQSREQRRRYVELYIERAKGSKDVDESEFDLLEDKLTIPSIIEYREVALETMKRQYEEEQAANGGAKASQLSYFSLSYWFQDDTSKYRNGEFSLTSSERKMIYDALEVNEATNSSPPAVQAQESYVIVRVEAALNKADFSLIYGSRRVELLNAEVEGMAVQFLKRKSSVEIGVVLQDALVLDKFSSKKFFVNTMKRMSDLEITAAHSRDALKLPAVRLNGCANKLPLLRANLQVPPLGDSDVDIKIGIVSQPVSIVCYLPYVLEILSFFARPVDINLSAFEEAAWNNAQALSTYSAAQVRDAILDRTKIMLEVDATAPTVRLVDNIGVAWEDNPNPRGTELTVFLGHMHAKTEIQSNDVFTSLEDASEYPKENQMYDRIRFKVDGIQARIATLKRSSVVSSSTILKRSSAHFDVCTSIAPQESKVPMVKLLGGLDCVEVELSSESYVLLLSLLEFFGTSVAENSAREAIVDDHQERHSSRKLLRTDSLRQAIGSASGNLMHRSESFKRHSTALTPKKHALKTSRSSASEAGDILTLDDVQKLMNKVYLYISFSIGKCLIRLLKPEHKVRSKASAMIPFAEATVENIMLQFSQRSYDMFVEFTLQSFHIRDSFTDFNSQPQLEKCLVYSKSTHETSSDALIQVRVSMLSEDDAPSCHIKALYAEISEIPFISSDELKSMKSQSKLPLSPIAIDVIFECLAVNLHQETIAEVMYFFLQNTKSTKAVGSRAADTESLSSTNPALVRRFSQSFAGENEAFLVSPAALVAKDSFPSSKVDIFVRVHVSQLSISLVDSKAGTLSDLLISNFAFKTTRSPVLTLVSAELGIFSINDPSISVSDGLVIGFQAPSTKLDGQKGVLSFVYESRGEMKNAQWFPGEINSATIHLESPRIRFLCRFFFEMQSYFLAGPILNAVRNIFGSDMEENEVFKRERIQSDIPESFSRNEPSSSEAKSSDLKIKISISNGVIEMPRNSSSRESLILRFEEISLYNRQNGSYSFTLSGLRIVTQTWNSNISDLEVFSLLGKTEIQADIVSAPYLVDISIVSEPIRFACSQTQYGFVCSSPLSNFNESPRSLQTFVIPSNAASATAPQSLESAMLTRLKVSIPEVSMVVLNGNIGYLPTPSGDLNLAEKKNEQSIAVLDILNVGFNLEYCNQLSMTLTVPTVSVRDLRRHSLVSSTYKTILLIGNFEDAKSKTPGIVINASSITVESESGTSKVANELSFTFNGLKVVPSSAVLELLTFFTTFDTAPLQFHEESAEAYGPDAAPIDSYSTTSIRIELLESSVLLVEDCSLLESRAILLNWGANSKLDIDVDGGIHLDFRIDNVEGSSSRKPGSLFEINNDLDCSKTNCLKPFNFEGSFIIDSDGSILCLIDCRKLIEVRLGYLDCTTITSAVNSILNSSNDAIESKDDFDGMSRSDFSIDSHFMDNEANSELCPSPIYYGDTDVQFYVADGELSQCIGYYDSISTITGKHCKYLVCPSSEADLSNFEAMTLKIFPVKIESQHCESNDKVPVRFGDIVQLCDYNGDLVRKYHHIGANGYLGPNGSSEPFHFRIWSKDTTPWNKDTRVICNGERIILEGVTLYSNNPSRSYFMFNGYGDAPVSLIVKSCVSEVPISTDVLVQEGQVELKTGHRTTHFKASLPGILLTVINDANNKYLPLFHLRLEALDMILRGRDIQSTFCLYAELEVSYYNFLLSAWEPLLEPWNFNASLHIEGGVICEKCRHNLEFDYECPNRRQPCTIERSRLRPFSDSSIRADKAKSTIRRELLANEVTVDRCNSILIASKVPLNLNISQPLIEVLMQFTETFGSANVSRAKSLGMHIYIDNQSGMDFGYSISEGGSQQNTVEEETSPEKLSPNIGWTTVEAGACEATSMQAHEAPEGRLKGPRMRLVWIKPQAHQFRESKPVLVSINYASSSFFRLLPNSDFSVICETVADQGTILIRIRSVIALKNVFPYPIHVRYFSTDNIDACIHDSGIIANGSQHYVPVHLLVSTTRLSVVPADINGELFTANEMIDLMDPVQKSKAPGDVEVVTDVCFKSASLSLQAVLIRVQEGPRSVSLELHPPVVVENLLPMGLSYNVIRVSQKENILSAAVNPSKAHFEGDIESGFSAAICYVDPDTSVQSSSVVIGISIPSLGCKTSILSDDTVIFGPRTLCDSINVVDHLGNVIQLRTHLTAACTYNSAIYSDTLNAPFRVCVFVDFWVIDRTGLDLLYSQRPNSSRVIYPQQDEDLGDDVRFTIMSSDSREFNAKASKISLATKSNQECWSKSFDVGTAGVRGNLILPPPSKTLDFGNRMPFADFPEDNCEIQHEFGLSVDLAKSKYSRTRVIVIDARYRMVNQTNSNILVRQEGEADGWIQILPGKETFFHWPNKDGPKRIQTRRVSPNEYFWSGAFELTSVGEFLIHLLRDRTCDVPLPGSESFEEESYLSVEIQLEDPSFVVQFCNRAKPFVSPYIIQNDLTSCQLIFYQPDCLTREFQTVRPLDSKEYILREPLGAKEVCIQLRTFPMHNFFLNVRDLAPTVVANAVIPLEKPKRFPVFEVDDENLNASLVKPAQYWVEIVMRGASKVIRVSEVQPGVSEEHRRRSRAHYLSMHKNLKRNITLAESVLAKSKSTLNGNILNPRWISFRIRDVMNLDQVASDVSNIYLLVIQGEKETKVDGQSLSNGLLWVPKPENCTFYETIGSETSNSMRIEIHQISGGIGWGSATVILGSVIIEPRESNSLKGVYHWKLSSSVSPRADSVKVSIQVLPSCAKNLSAVVAEKEAYEISQESVLAQELATAFQKSLGLMVKRDPSFLDSDEVESEASINENVDSQGSNQMKLSAMIMNLDKFQPKWRPTADTEIYCSLSFGESTQSSDFVPLLAGTRTKPNHALQTSINEFQRPDTPLDERIIKVAPTSVLGLDLLFNSGFLMVRGISTNGQCSRLPVYIGDSIVEVNGESMKVLSKSAALAKLNDALHNPETAKEEMISIKFKLLRSTGNSSYYSEWNRCLSFSSPTVPNVDERLHVVLYLKNKEGDRQYSATEESAIVPFLYFFGQDSTLSELDHSRYENFDLPVGEGWVPIPKMNTSLEPLEVLCAIYSATGEKQIIGEIRMALKWDIDVPKPVSDIKTFFQLDISGIGISLVDGLPQPKELLFASVSGHNAENSNEIDNPGISASLATCMNGKQVVNFNVDQFQIDNQLPETNYPVFLAPVRNDVDSCEAPSLQIMAVVDSSGNIISVDYVLCQLMELEVKMEDSLLLSLVRMVTGIQWNSVTEDAVELQERRRSDADSLKLNRQLMSLADLPHIVESFGKSSKAVIGWMLICPIRLNITFSSTSETPLSDAILSENLGTVLRSIIGAAATVLTNLDQAPIRIPEFYSENLFETMHTLLFFMLQHYKYNGLRSIYKVIGSVDFLGNPVGLISTLGTGVKEFFYTPAQMLLENEDGLRIENLRTGMTKGSKSLLKNTAMGIFHTTGKISETLGKGVAMLAMDAEYNAERQRRKLKQTTQIQDVGDGIREGAKGIAGGVWQGIKGVVYDPVRGAEADGAGGFVFGLGKGVAGLVVKPTAGILDLFANISQGVQGTAASMDDPSNGRGLHRIRLPRRFGPDSVLLGYSAREAEGWAVLLLHGLDSSDVYVYHLHSGDKNHRSIVILTDKRVLCTGANRGNKLWELPNDSSLKASIEDSRLSISHGGKTLVVQCDTRVQASRFQLALASCSIDAVATRYFLLNLESSNSNLQQLDSAATLEGMQQPETDLMTTHLLQHVTEDDLRTQPLRTIRVSPTDCDNHDAMSSSDNSKSFWELPYTVYQVTVLGGPYEWKVYRRYSDFVKLHQDLVSDGYDMSHIPSLPAKRLLKTHDSVVKERVDALGNYLQNGVCMDSSLSQSAAVLSFVTSGARQIRFGVGRRRTLEPSNVKRSSSSATT